MGQCQDVDIPRFVECLGSFQYLDATAQMAEMGSTVDLPGRRVGGLLQARQCQGPGPVFLQILTALNPKIQKYRHPPQGSKSTFCHFCG